MSTGREPGELKSQYEHRYMYVGTTRVGELKSQLTDELKDD